MRLILMRHAKSSWDNLNLSDHDRPLNERGRAACDTVGAWLVKQGYLAQEALSSTAARCVETYELTAQAAGIDPSIEYRRSLYHASPEQMLSNLQMATGQTVMMLGHNPGIGFFAGELVGPTATDHPKFMTYPTAAVTVMDFSIESWKDAGFGKATLEAFITPSDLI